MRCITKSPEIEAALQDIYFYTAEHWGTAQADKYYGQLMDAFDRLAENPDLGRRHLDVPEPYRVYKTGRHMVAYHAKPDELQIVAIFHDAMDIDARMGAVLQKRRLH